jgi:hypothetical protein
MAVFWVTHRPDDGGSRHLWNVGKFLTDYTTAQQLRRQPSLYSMRNWNISYNSGFSEHFCYEIRINNIVENRANKKYRLMLVFWVVRPGGLVGRHQHFGGTYCLHLQPRRPTSSPTWESQISTRNTVLLFVTTWYVPHNSCKQ